MNKLKIEKCFNLLLELFKGDEDHKIVQIFKKQILNREIYEPVLFLNKVSQIQVFESLFF